MSYSAKNTLKVFVSPYSTYSTQLTVAELLVNEIGFYDAAGNIAASGAGYFHWRKSDGQVQKSKLITFAGWSGIKSYAAPTMEVQTITVPSNDIGVLYQVTIETKLPGMQGEYIKHGNHKTITGDTTTSIATALALSLNNNFTREENSYFTITSSSADVIITSKLQTYKKAKFQGRPLNFKAFLNHPQDDAVAGVLTTPGADGVGYGPYIAEQEMFAQGDHDGFRFGGYPNSFDFDALEANASGQYDVLHVSEDTAIKTAMDLVTANQDYLICFDNTVPSVETDIIAFTLPEQDAPAVINPTTHAITIDVAIGTTVTALIPTYALSPGATVSPLSGVADDFTSQVTATVTAEDGSTTQAWTIDVTVLT